MFFFLVPNACYNNPMKERQDLRHIIFEDLYVGCLKDDAPLFGRRHDHHHNLQRHRHRRCCHRCYSCSCPFVPSARSSLMVFLMVDTNENDLSKTLYHLTRTTLFSSFSNKNKKVAWNATVVTHTCQAHGKNFPKLIIILFVDHSMCYNSSPPRNNFFWISFLIVVAAILVVN
jgi:hypothetical protein